MRHSKHFHGQGESQLPGGTMHMNPFYSLIPLMNKHDSDFWHNGTADRFWPERTGQLHQFSPTLDMDEDDEKYVMNIELPGVSQDDVEIRVKEDSLLIQGEKRSEESQEGEGEGYSERRYGKFRRYMKFEHAIDTDAVQANCKDGLLRITLPKKEAHRIPSKSIPIQFEEK